MIEVGTVRLRLPEPDEDGDDIANDCSRQLDHRDCGMRNELNIVNGSMFASARTTSRHCKILVLTFGQSQSDPALCRSTCQSARTRKGHVCITTVSFLSTTTERIFILCVAFTLFSPSGLRTFSTGVQQSVGCAGS